MKIRLAVLTFLLVLIECISPVAGTAQQSPGAMFAASDGKGHVSLLWFPPPSRWPLGGWRLLDSSGQVLVPKITMGEAAALQNLSVEDADAIRKLPEVLAKPDANAARRKQLVNVLGLRALSEPGYARALGLSWTLDNVARGSHVYRVQGLGASGQPMGLELSSPAVDSAQATPLPPPPDGLQARSAAEGVSLLWAPPVEDRKLPVITFAIEREGGGQAATPVTAKPIVAGTRWDPKTPLVVDRVAPPNEMLTYRVFSVDIFGRRSPPSSIRIFFPDFRALVPPEPVRVQAEPAKDVVTWNAQNKPNLAGWVVERAFLESGPYEVLTAQALPVSTATYEDAAVRGGTSYYYRVRAVSPRGDLGPPSHAAMGQPTNPAIPPRVAGLRAEAGQTRIRLTWQPVSFPVAGYFVERRAASGIAGAENWVRLNPHLVPEPQYDDYLGLASDVKLQYRILAVAFDNAEGPASEPVQVVVADRSLPQSPTITRASGADGKVMLAFVPAPPLGKTTQFLVLRSGRADDLGVVIGDPLPGGARQFQDQYVRPGESYWYRLVAVDKAGNRSDPTLAVAVRVGSPAIPQPAIPAVQFLTAPNPHVVVQFAKAPAGFSAIVERQASANSGWLRVAGPIQELASAVDNAPPQGPVAYRVSYVSADGKVGPSSQPATLNLGK